MYAHVADAAAHSQERKHASEDSQRAHGAGNGITSIDVGGLSGPAQWKVIVGG
jgi:hypothetical protein